jgi:gamma-glutamyltranspeptidase/glutathione hydrolase
MEEEKRVRGAIAAGSRPTAEAGAEVLQAGGNAADAAVAAGFATAAGEPTLTSLAGGGALLFYDAARGEVRACDFFANAPGLGAPAASELDFAAVDVSFGPATQQFFVGAGAAAVPGTLPGLCTALERWGRLPLREVIRPAVRALREGAALEPFQQRVTRMLQRILTRSPASARLFAPGGRLLDSGDLFRNPALADTLEALAAGPWRAFYDGVLAPAMLRQFGLGAGGRMTAEDLQAYTVEIRDPLSVGYRGATLLTNPPPALGGRMVTLMLALLEQADVGALAPWSADHLHALCRAMQTADEARAQGAAQLSPARLERWQERFRQLEGRPLGRAPAADGGPGSTTHVSVLDAEGNAASLTLTYGEGCGQLIGHSGIPMNNLMGERDLFPQGFHRWPAGRRLATMIAPSLLLSADGAVCALGTGGANRIRTALAQVVSYLVDHGLPPRRAVQTPRVHLEQGVLSGETLGDPGARQVLASLGARRVVPFDEPNLFFGGVQLVQATADGSLLACADYRRDGVSRVV